MASSSCQEAFLHYRYKSRRSDVKQRGRDPACDQNGLPLLEKVLDIFGSKNYTAR
jgi:hypothetical protein